MRQKVSPAMVIAIAVVLLGGIGCVAWYMWTGKSSYGQVVVKPVQPDDPKYRPDPKLGLGGT